MFEQGGHSQPLSRRLSFWGPTARRYLQVELSRLGLSPACGHTLTSDIGLGNILDPPTQKVLLVYRCLYIFFFFLKLPAARCSLH